MYAYGLLPAHFDGERIQLDEPFSLAPNTKLLVTVLIDTEQEFWEQISLNGLDAAYGDDEPIYDLDDIKEPNPDHAAM